MAYFPAQLALIKMGSDTIGQATGYTLNRTTDLEEVTGINTTTKAYTPELTDWTASIDVKYDLADAGQLDMYNAITPGTALTAHFYVDATHKADGSCLVKSVQYKVQKGSVITVTIALQGNGALSAVA